jgi:hypothetical protein
MVAEGWVRSLMAVSPSIRCSLVRFGIDRGVFERRD